MGAAHRAGLCPACGLARDRRASELALRNDVYAAVVQGLPDAQIEIDFQAGLLLVKLVWQTDTQQVVRQLLDLALALFEERAEVGSLVGVSQSHVTYISHRAQRTAR